MYRRFVKRLLDVLLSLIVLVVFSPVYAVVALLVRIRLGSPVIFHQERPGLHGEIFRLYKFRSMSDARGADGELLPDEERLTGFGRMLRATSLDELPEFVNILRGDMSFVGPRPLLVKYLPWYTEQERHRHDVRPGLTGLAQVNGRNALGWEERFAYDLRYVMSFGLDVRITLRTITKVFSRSDVLSGAQMVTEDFDIYRKKQLEKRT